MTTIVIPSPVCFLPQILGNIFTENETQDVLFQYNVQHDSDLAGCIDSGQRQVVQERVESGVSENFLVHVDTTEWYLINTHRQHNSHLICEALPCNLTVPIPYALD
jgi:hypothetical protein